MRRLFHLVVVLILLSPSASRAQTASGCRVQLRDACQKAEDVYTFLLPQLGAGIAGGHPVLGSTNVLGRLGRFSLGVRATVVRGSVPELDNLTVSETGAVRSDIPTPDQLIPVPVVDGAFGLFRGFPLGVTHVGGLDALVAFSYLPEPGSDESEFQLPDGTTRFGFGVRVGLLEESIVVPAVTFAYLRRPLPKLSFSSTTQDGVRIGVDGLDIEVSTWRLIATKSFMAFTLSGGIGGDKYESSGAIQASDPSLGPFVERIGLDRSIARTNMFVDLTLRLGPVRLTGEVGGVSGGSLTTFNTFDRDASASRTYASLGVRLGF